MSDYYEPEPMQRQGPNGMVIGLAIFAVLATFACGSMYLNDVGLTPSATPDPYRATYTAQVNERLNMQAGQTATVSAFERAATATQAEYNIMIAEQEQDKIEAQWAQETAVIHARETEIQGTAVANSVRATETAVTKETERAWELIQIELKKRGDIATSTAIAQSTLTALEVQEREAQVAAQNVSLDAEKQKIDAATSRMWAANQFATWFPYAAGSAFFIAMFLVAVWIFNRQTTTTPHYADNKGAMPVFTDRHGRVIVPENAGHPVIDPNKRDNLPDDMALRLGLAGKGVAGIRALPPGMSNAARQGVKHLTGPTQIDLPASDYKMLEPGKLSADDVDVLDSTWRDADDE